MWWKGTTRKRRRGAGKEAAQATRKMKGKGGEGRVEHDRSALDESKDGIANRKATFQAD